EVALPGLQAEGAVPAGPGAVRQLDPQLGAVVVEHAAHRATFVLGVGVGGARQLHPQGFERAQVVEAAAYFLAALVHDDVHLAVGVAVVAAGVVVLVSVFVVMVMVMPMPRPVSVSLAVAGMGVAGHAVAAGVQAGAGADESAVAHPGQAERGAV